MRGNLLFRISADHGSRADHPLSGCCTEVRRSEVLLFGLELAHPAKQTSQLISAHLRVVWRLIVGQHVGIGLEYSKVGTLSLRKPPAVLAMDDTRLDPVGYVRFLFDAATTRLDEHPVTVFDSIFRCGFRMDLGEWLRVAFATQG